VWALQVLSKARATIISDALKKEKGAKVRLEPVDKLKRCGVLGRSAMLTGGPIHSEKRPHAKPRAINV
jgi:hypothetical protein